MKVELEVREILWKKVRSAGKAGVLNVPKNWIGRNVITQKIRIFPTKEQEKVLLALSENCRLIYNLDSKNERKLGKIITKLLDTPSSRMICHNLRNNTRDTKATIRKLCKLF